MRRRVIRESVGILLALSISSVLAGCNLFRDSPEVVVVKYLQAIFIDDYETAYEFISDRDKRYRTKEQYLEESLDLTTRKVFHTLRRYETKKAVARGNVAEVEVSLTFVPGSQARIVGSLMGAPLDSERRRFTLIKEGERWKIFLNWEKLTEI